MVCVEILDRSLRKPCLQRATSLLQKDLMKNYKLRIAAAFAAGALTFTGAGMVAPTALAQENGAEPTLAPSQGAHQIDPNATGTLNIFKYEGDPGTEYVDAAPTGATPLPGVTFNVQRVDGVDLTTQDGWAELATMTPTNLQGNTLGATTAVTTGANGQATFTGPVGVYLVTETAFGSYTVAPPFLITLPYAGENGAWQYERNVYPKNQNVKPDKQVNDNDAALGENLHYTINAPVPAGDLDTLTITDPLNANLALVADSAVVTAENVTFVDGDYTVSYADNTLVVDFTEAGLAKLQTARVGAPDLAVSVAFDAEVASLPTDGVITNTATVTYPNGATLNTDVDVNGTPTPTSTTFAPITITKTGTGLESGDTLDGAVFEVYHCNAQDELLGEALTIATTNTGPTATELTTGGFANGQSTVTGFGLPATSFSGGNTGSVENTYCVLETQAPTGFVRNPEPQPVNYDSASNTFTVSVNNQKDSIFGQLPATGAWGIVIAFLIGLALLARGLYTSYRDNKATA